MMLSATIATMPPSTMLPQGSPALLTFTGCRPRPPPPLPAGPLPGPLPAGPLPPPDPPRPGAALAPALVPAFAVRAAPVAFEAPEFEALALTGVAFAGVEALVSSADETADESAATSSMASSSAAVAVGSVFGAGDLPELPRCGRLPEPDLRCVLLDGMGPFMTSVRGLALPTKPQGGCSP